MAVNSASKCPLTRGPREHKRCKQILFAAQSWAHCRALPGLHNTTSLPGVLGEADDLFSPLHRERYFIQQISLDLLIPFGVSFRPLFETSKGWMEEPLPPRDGVAASDSLSPEDNRCRVA